MTEVASVVLFSAPAHTIDFYRALGVGLEGEDHGDGVAHAAADVGGVHFAVLAAPDSFPPAQPAGSAPAWRAGGSTFVGLYVESLDDVLSAVMREGATILAGHQVREWGCRAVVEDPDGRAVEINQRGHCT